MNLFKSDSILFFLLVIFYHISAYYCELHTPASEDPLSHGVATTHKRDGRVKQSNRNGLIGEKSGSLWRLGLMTVDMVKALTMDKDGRTIDIKAVTEVVHALTEGVIQLEYPEEKVLLQYLKMGPKLHIFEEEVDEKLKSLSQQRGLLKDSIDLVYDRAGVDSYLTSDVTSSSTDWTVIQFNKVNSQGGALYDSSRGTLTCHVDGEYLVSSTIKTKGSSNDNTYLFGHHSAPNAWQMGVYMKVQGSGPDVHIVSRESPSPGRTVALNTVVHCPQSAQLWVQVKGSVTVQGGDHLKPYSSFTVAFLKPTQLTY